MVANRKPTALKLLHGDDKVHPERINRNEPRPQGEVSPPPYLSQAAALIWAQLAPDMTRAGVLTAWDVPMFGELCEALMIARLSRVNVVREANGSYVVAPGAPSPANSWVKAMTVVNHLAGRFGITPADRTRLMTPPEVSGHGSAQDLLSS